MSKHSKNNCARGFFTYEEKQKLNYGTIKQRLGRDSLRNFDSCFLCLQTARTPLACSLGHIACKECLYENIMAQKKELARLTQLYESQEAAAIVRFAYKKLKDQEEQKMAEMKKKEEEIIKFEQTQTRVGLEETNATPARTDEVAKLKSDPSKIASFWIPYNVPGADLSKLKKPKQDVQCLASNEDHSISCVVCIFLTHRIKKLIEVKFQEIETQKVNGQKIGEKICPSCSKTMSNATLCILLKSCGHVFCKLCTDQFIKSSRKCMVCDEKCREKDLLALKSEGTGYVSGGGKVQVEKVTEAFQ